MSPWAVLGLKPGADRAEIRRAYARLLKSTNPEDDPEGFMALRAAHDAALNQLQWRQQWPDIEDADDTPPPAEADAPPPPELAPPPTPESAQDPAFAAERDDLLARQESLIAAIEAGPDGQRAAFEALLAAPALDGVAARAGVENWLAGLIANCLPASDPLVVPAIEQFGWEDLPRDRTPPAIVRLLQRREEGEFVARIARPHTDLHVGYMALSKPPGPRWLFKLGALFSAAPAQTRSILGLIDGPMPGIADWLNGDAIAAWRDWHSQVRLRLWMIFTMLPLGAVVLVGLLEASGWPEPARQGVGLLAWGAPFGLLAVLRWRQRWLAVWDRPDWHYTHWPLAMAALPLLAALWPAVPALTPLFLVPVLAVVIWPLLALDRLEPAGWRELAPGLVRSQPVWLALMLLIGGAVGVDGGAPVRVLACAALALLWWQGGDALAWMAERRLGVRAGWLLSGAAVAVAGLAAALPLLPFDKAMLAGRGLALLPLGLLAALIGFRQAQGALQLVPTLAIGALWPAVLQLHDVIDPVRAASIPDQGGSNLIDRAIMVLLVIGVIQLVNIWRNRGREGFDNIAPAVMLIAFALAGILFLFEDDRPRYRPPPRPIATTQDPDMPDVIGFEQDWFDARAVLETLPKGEYAFTLLLAVDDRGRVKSCQLTRKTGAAVLDAILCPQVTARARFKPKAAIFTYKGGWDWDPGAIGIASVPAAPIGRYRAPKPIGDGATWVPLPPAVDAARPGRYGLEARLQVRADGRVAACGLERPSGIAAVDKDVCRLLIANGRYRPARNDNGQPVAAVEFYWLEWTVKPRQAVPPPVERAIVCPQSQVSGPMVAEPCMADDWIADGAYPAGPLARRESGTVRYRLHVDTAGRVERCDVTGTSGHVGLDRDTCALLTRRARFVPAQDVDGSPMTWEYDSAVSWQLATR